MHFDKQEEILENLHIKLFQCNVCTRVFADKEDLKRHVYIHNNEKPFKCAYCNKGFNDRSNKRQHERSHQVVRKLNCEICSLTFSRPRELKNHVLTHHGTNDLQKKEVEEMVMGNLEDGKNIDEQYESQEILPSMMETFVTDQKNVIVEQVRQVFMLELTLKMT